MGYRFSTNYKMDGTVGIFSGLTGVYNAKSRYTFHTIYHMMYMGYYPIHCYYGYSL